MAFDEALAGRVRNALATRKGIVEKKMFGGVAFLVRGNMCVGVHGDELIVRLKPEAAERALSEPNVRRFDLTGRPMKGWLLVTSDGLAAQTALRRWVDAAVAFASSLPPKP